MLAREAIVRFFESKGFEFVFHLPGIHTLSLDDALSRSNIRVITGRHESNSGFTADGYARATGKAALLLTTPGPGIGNCVSACMEAYADDVPLIVLYVDVKRKDVEKGVLHGVSGCDSLFADIAKAHFSVVSEKNLLAALDRAYALAVASRQGPVVISIAYELLDRDLPVYPAGQSTIPPDDDRRRRPPDWNALERVLHGKERPVIVAGRALMVSGAGQDIENLCRSSHIPILTTAGGKGTIPEDREWAFGDVTSKGVAREILGAADSVIALGTRLRRVDTRSRGVKLHDLAHIDVDDRWLRKNYRTDLALVADMKEVVDAIASIVQSKTSAWDIERLADRRTRQRRDMERMHEGFRIVQLLRALIPRDATTVWDPTILGYWAEQWFPVFRAKSFVAPRGVSPTFYGLPAAIGAKLGCPDHPCLCVTGDGSFLPTVAELSTIAAGNIPVGVLLYNNASFGVLEDSMRRRHYHGESMKLTNPDFVALVRSFGIRAERADTLERLEAVFRTQVRWDEPFVVEFCFPIVTPPW